MENVSDLNKCCKKSSNCPKFSAPWWIIIGGATFPFSPKKPLKTQGYTGCISILLPASSYLFYFLLQAICFYLFMFAFILSFCISLDKRNSFWTSNKLLVNKADGHPAWCQLSCLAYFYVQHPFSLFQSVSPWFIPVDKYFPYFP